jgi:WD40 repeat protein
MTLVKNSYNPYPGLRPFSSNENKHFFGRENHPGIIIDKILQNRFVALIGASGAGKTSLINAGIIPALAKHRPYVGTSWKVIVTRPGKSPVDNLSIAIAESVNNGRNRQEEKVQPGWIAEKINESPVGLAEALTEIQKDKKESILIVIDNFEDLCLQFKKQHVKVDKGKCEEFIRILIEARNNRKVPVHLLLSVRSAFLEECYQIGPLGHLIEESHYKIPQLTTEDLKKVIHLPAAKWGTQIDPALEKQLLRDIVDKTYQLPLLQHVLSRIWDYWLEQNVDKPLSLAEYEATGGIDNAVSLSAEEAFLELSEKDRRICESIFKTLTEKVSGNTEIINPVTVNELAFVSRAGADEVIGVIENFCQRGRKFFLSHNGPKLDKDSIIELSHESLIKLWGRLQSWVDEEYESVSTYLRLAEYSRLYQMGKADLLGEEELRQAWFWKEKHEPTYHWAKRHNSAFERTMQYLTLSREAYEYNEYQKYKKSKRSSRLRKVFTVLVILLGLSTFGMVFFMTDMVSEIVGHVESIVSRERTSVRQDQVVEPITDDTGDEFQQPETSPPMQQDVPGNAETSTEVPLPDSPGIAARDLPLRPPRELPGAEVREVPGSQGRLLPPAERRRPESPGENDNVALQPTHPAPPPDQPAARVETPVAAPEVAPEALNRRMIAISQSLAVRSIQEDNNPDLKALLAFQSHAFNERYQGSANNPDILSGLISSVQLLYGDDHNIYRAHTESVNSLVFRPNSTNFYSASSDGQVLRWDVNDTSKTPETLINTTVVNNLISLSPNGQWLAIATDGAGIRVINPTSNSRSAMQINWGNNRVIAMDFDADNENIIFAGSDNSLVRHNIRSGNSVTLGKTESEVLSISVSPDGRLIATGTRAGQVVVFGNEPGSSPRVIHDEPGNDILSVAFNNNGSRLAAGNVGGAISIIEVATGNLLTTLSGHTARVVDIEFCPAGRFIASTSFDGSIRIWNAQNLNSRPVVLREHGSWVRAVAFSSNGDRMVTGSRQEARLRAWTLNPNELASMICERLSRNMTHAEWNQFVGEDIPYMESCPQLTNN